MDRIRAGAKALALTAWIGLCCLPILVAKKLGHRRSRDIVIRICYQGLLLICGIRLKITGRPADERPLLMVTNHLSYLDIMILGAVAPVRFTPKSEIGDWPVIGFICRICDSVFIDRRPDKIGETKAALQAALGQGELVCLFPEATTGNGLHLQPFKSSFFSLAEEPAMGGELAIQPAAIRYRRIRRLPIDTTQWPLLAWYGDMELVPHLWNVLKLGSVDAEITFLPTVTLPGQGDRKQLAAHCHQAINEAMGR